MLRQIIIPVGPSIAYVELTQGLFACIDSDDSISVGKYNWYTHNSETNFYAFRHIKRSNSKGYDKQSMHGFILGLSGNKITADHIRTGNGLDNRRANLRPATRKQQMQNRRMHKNNSTGYKGVSTRGSKYLAMIWNGKENIRLGLFHTAELAHEAYITAAKGAYGEFAHS